MVSSELGFLLSGFDSKSSPLERFAVKKLSSVPSFLLIHAHSDFISFILELLGVILLLLQLNLHIYLILNFSTHKPVQSSTTPLWHCVSICLSCENKKNLSYGEQLVLEPKRD